MGTLETILAISTPSLAAIAAYFTRTQARIDEYRRRQELFGIRYAFYQRLRGIYIQLARSGEPFEVTDFFDLAEEASFLFGEEVAKHIISIADQRTPEQVRHGIVDDWFVKPFKKYLQLK